MRGCEALALLALPANCKSKEPLTAGPLPGCFRASDGQLLRVFQNWRITRLGRGGMIVRIFGCVLFILGFLISLSIVGAIFGVPMMGLGVLLMIFGGGRRKVVINNVVSVNSAPAALPREMQSDFVDAQPRAPRWEPLPEPRDRQALPPPNRSHDREPGLRTINPDPYDKAKWKALVEYDPDISRVVSALSPYGQKYVDQLATGYLALNDKSYLPMIVQKILATAKEDAARRA